MARSPTTIPFAMAALGIAIFSAMDALMKGLSLSIGAYNACLWRVLAGAGMMGIAFLGGRRSMPSRTVLGLHGQRGAVSAAMNLLFFWGIARVPLAEGIALSFIAPLLTLYLAAVLLKEEIGIRAVLASLIGLLGVAVILLARLSGHNQPGAFWGVIAILISAILYSYNLILQRKQALLALPLEIAFFNSVIVSIILLVAAPFWAILPQISEVPSILGTAVLASMSILLISWAYARAEAKVLVAVEYTAFIWAAILGYLVFQEAVSLATIIGTTLIVLGCIVAARQEQTHQPSAELGL